MYTPTEYFNMVKDRKKQITEPELKEFYKNCLSMIKKCKETGQVSACKKIVYFMEVVEKELELVKMGINTFVYKDDIEDYIDNIADDVVKIIELKNYEREIPDELVETVSKTKNIFDNFFVVFTDYTGKAEKKVEQIRRDKDPILFGSFESVELKVLTDRFYYLGDWVDEYCDLTLNKMISECHRDIENEVIIPQTLDEIRSEIYNMENKQPPKKMNFFQKIKSKLRFRQ